MEKFIINGFIVQGKNTVTINNNVFRHLFWRFHYLRKNHYNNKDGFNNINFHMEHIFYRIYIIVNKNDTVKQLCQKMKHLQKKQ